MKLLKKYWLVLVLGLVVLLRLPSLSEPFTYGDEGIYLTLGQAANKGWVWYRDIHDNKPPMLYLIAALAGNFTFYRLIHFGWSLVTVLAFWQLAKLLFVKNQPAVMASTVIFAVLSNLHSFEGNVANAENFMMLPTIAAFYLIYEFATDRKLAKQKIKKTWWAWLLAGVLFSVATLFKVPAAFDFAAGFAFVFLIFIETKKKKIKLLASHLSLLFLGFILPILLTFINYFAKGALSPYLTAAFFQNLPYLSSWSGGQTQAGGLPVMMLVRMGLVLTLVTGIYLFREKISLPAKLLLTWFGFSWFAALLSTRPYPHYLIQILPAFCLSIGLFAFQKKKYQWQILLPLVLAIIFRITFLAFQFWTYEDRPYYLNYYQYLLGLKTHQQYWHDFDPQAEKLYQTAAYVKARTAPDDTIFIWGTQPSIYALAKRQPAGRYTTSYHIIDFDGYDQTMTALKREAPRFLLVSLDEKRPFPELFSFLWDHYALEKQLGGLKIFHRIKR
jgi:4-amino-4-deoxy-L-arabinose transferase-like glycosyltransferase